MGNKGWQELPLDKIYDIRSGLSKAKSEFGFGYGFLSFKDVFNNFFVPPELSELVNSSEKEQNSCSIKRGDVFLTRTSETIDELGMSCVALKNYEKATFNGFTKRLRPKKSNIILPEYAAYYFRSPQFRRDVTAMSSPSTRASLNNEMLSKLTIKFPNIDVQHAIAHILKVLDDKIVINTQANQTLESMAQALFKSWFVDFNPVIDNVLASGKKIPKELEKKAEIRKSLGKERKELPEDIKRLFPDEFEFSDELGWIPKGWGVKNIGDVIKILGGGTPSTKDSSFWSTKGNAFCTPKDMSTLSSKVLLKTERYLTDKGVKKVSSGQLDTGTVLMSSRAPIGYFAVSHIPVTVNQGIITMQSTETFSNVYLLCWGISNIDKILSRANGSTFLEISKKNFRTIPFLIPNEKILLLFQNYSKVFYERMVTCSKDISVLIDTRDHLLPKLISGELKIPEAEKIIKDHESKKEANYAN